MIHSACVRDNVCARFVQSCKQFMTKDFLFSFDRPLRAKATNVLSRCGAKKNDDVAQRSLSAFFGSLDRLFSRAKFASRIGENFLLTRSA